MQLASFSRGPCSEALLVRHRLDLVATIRAPHVDQSLVWDSKTDGLGSVCDVMR